MYEQATQIHVTMLTVVLCARFVDLCYIFESFVVIVLHAQCVEMSCLSILCRTHLYLKGTAFGFLMGLLLVSDMTGWLSFFSAKLLLTDSPMFILHGFRLHMKK